MRSSFAPRQGEAPRLEEYEQRFPQFAVELQAHFEVHQAMLLGNSAPFVQPTIGDDLDPRLEAPPRSPRCLVT